MAYRQILEVDGLDSSDSLRITIDSEAGLIFTLRTAKGGHPRSSRMTTEQFDAIKQFIDAAAAFDIEVLGDLTDSTVVSVDEDGDDASDPEAEPDE